MYRSLKSERPCFYLAFIQPKGSFENTKLICAAKATNNSDWLLYGSWILVFISWQNRFPNRIFIYNHNLQETGKCTQIHTYIHFNFANMVGSFILLLPQSPFLTVPVGRIHHNLGIKVSKYSKNILRDIMQGYLFRGLNKENKEGLKAWKQTRHKGPLPKTIFNRGLNFS